MTDPIRLSVIPAAVPAPARTDASAPVRPADRTGAEGEAVPAIPVSARPRVDQYVPGEPSEPSGLYRPESDGDGSRKIRFDDPSSDPPSRSESATYDTGDVDREIERLRERVEQLRERIRTEKDPDRAERLEQDLARAEAELSQKDRDGYRRAHAHRS